MWKRAAVVVVGLLLAVVGSASAQEADVLTGRVLAEDGRPLAGARVEVMSVESEITRSVITNADGRYMLIFPDGGGAYLVRVTFLGMADVVQLVMREAEEELLLTNVTMRPQAIELEALAVTAWRTPSEPDEVADRTTELAPDLLNRLPLPDLDPHTLALLAEGVVPTSLDSLTGVMGFSVAGMSDLLNQITLDGILLGEDGLGVPEEGIRQTRITTSTFDVSRGGFAGGLVAMTTARGTNRSGGTLTYRLDDDALQVRATPTTNAFTRQHFGGSWGGPVIANQLFYNTSFQFSRNVNHRFALAADDPLAAIRSGVNVDSIARFLSILEADYGIETAGQTGAYQQLSGDVRLQGRLDWNALQRQSTSQTLSARFNLNLNSQDSTRINSLDLAHHGGETERNSYRGSVNVTSRFGGQWTNQLNVSYGENWSEALPYIEMPQGQVRVTSEFEDGTRNTRTLVFGGNRSMPMEARSRDVQLSNDLSFLLPLGDQLHRFKVGGSFQRTADTRRSTDNLFGTFTFNSLADFEANRPARYERTLTERETETGRVNVGLYVGDTWRVSAPLELTMGLRWDYSRLNQRPEYNPLVEGLFGRRTDIDPVATAWSPRLGFNYRLNQPGQPPRALSGGAGYFAGRAPTNIFTAAVRQTGLSDADQRLVCIGDTVPFPAWDVYLADPSAVPDTCDGGVGSSVFSSRAPAVTLIDPDQRLPSSLRLDLAYRTRLPLDLQGNFRYVYSRGIGLWAYRDINLDESRTFLLGGEDRVFFGDAEAVVPGTGAVSSVASRVHPELASVYEVTSAGRSASHQFTARVNGLLPPGILFSANYTLGFARDQGAASFARTSTAGNPNLLEWGTSDNDRRHNLNLILSYPVGPALEITAMSRITSGAPFTPMVNRDINGDGARNDRAFVFDPRTTADTAVANGMLRMLESAPVRVRDCIESQFGMIAARNACRNGWNQSLDLRASLRPSLPGLDRRFTLSVDARNVLTGLDQLVNGRNAMRGWGEGQRADATLLEVRGFDPATRSFVYEVNEGFGQARRGPNAFRNAFSLTISGRLAIGAAPRGAMAGIGGIAGTGRGGFGGGGFGGLSGRGGIGGLAALMQGGAASIGERVATMLANPVLGILEMRETLGLTGDQVARIQIIADTLDARLEPRREALTAAFERTASALGAGAFDPQAIQQMQRDMQPALTAAGSDIAMAMRQAERELTPEQWQAVPASVRNLTEGGFLSGVSGLAAGRGGFNALAMVDRMLANPLPVLLDLRETLELTPDQVSRIEVVSDSLDARLLQRRDELGRRFDNVQGAQQAQLFQQLQPQIEAGRGEIADALRAVQGILTADQWERVPEAIRDPFRGPQGRFPGGPRGGPPGRR